MRATVGDDPGARTMKGWVGQARLMTTQWVNHRLLTESHKYPSPPPRPLPRYRC
jgi:hypothetical protein